jgi:hypothetical protein
MPGFLAGIAVDPVQRTAAVALANATVGDTPGLGHTLLDLLAEQEPRPPEPWHPEPEVAGADELLGLWYWGNTPFTLVVRHGQLGVRGPNSGRCSRWRGLDQYFTGETLAVLRAADGTVERLDLATYALTPAPYGG